MKGVTGHNSVTILSYPSVVSKKFVVFNSSLFERQARRDDEQWRASREEEQRRMAFKQAEVIQ